jgi:hypothetical protein
MNSILQFDTVNIFSAVSKRSTKFCKLVCHLGNWRHFDRTWFYKENEKENKERGLQAETKLPFEFYPIATIREYEYEPVQFG